ncbi:unnamed protein product [Triticum turgidum subsp. durum]|uniref:Glutamate decarboxylase n=1 Tax=Triticum turgidum subsp. durum TaxID=4567 RepID=A0A9R1RNT4_TRITD|nr:unnamed protein product [Triticum turgidum subsp. durum]
MALSRAQTSSGESLISSTFASRYVRTALPRFRMPEQSIPKDAAYQIINDELMLDGNPRLNLASFVTTWMEPECDKLIQDSVNKNYVDMDEYPVTTEFQNRCVNMIAHLFNAPIGEDETAVGVGTVGSSEAIMLAGLAFKRKWQNKMKAEGKPHDKPNIVTGANVQVCWEKFARYFEVELKEVKLREGYYVMDPEKAVELVDENTICVAAILGSTLNGEFEDVKRLNDLLVAKNAETGWDTPIHVDAASGGFIAPFIYPELEWDFRLPLVKSINVSGHKYGLVYAGVGWVIWRNKEDLPDELIFHINYLGADQPTFTLNFSKGSSQIIAQYYQLIRLGFEATRTSCKIAGTTQRCSGRESRRWATFTWCPRTRACRSWPSPSRTRPTTRCSRWSRACAASAGLFRHTQCPPTPSTSPSCVWSSVRTSAAAWPSASSPTSRRSWWRWTRMPRSMGITSM